jgi:hypothetical protein
MFDASRPLRKVYLTAVKYPMRSRICPFLARQPAIERNMFCSAAQAAVGRSSLAPSPGYHLSPFATNSQYGPSFLTLLYTHAHAPRWHVGDPPQTVRVKLRSMPYMTAHFEFPSLGWPASWPFSISAIMFSNALVTFSL